jgi:hypothetical protein
VEAVAGSVAAPSMTVVIVLSIMTAVINGKG